MNIESTRPKTRSFTRTPVVINQYPENQYDFSRKKVVPTERPYKSVLNEKKNKDNSKQSNPLMIRNANYIRNSYVLR